MRRTSVNYYEWLASQYAYRYPDLYHRLLPLIDEELSRFDGRGMSPYDMDRIVDNIYRRYHGLYPQTYQYRDRDGSNLRNIILILLLSRLFRRGRFGSPGFPGFSFNPFY